MSAPLVLAYGMGVDSTAALVGMATRGIRPDKILFADTGGEKPETYAYRQTIDAWLEAHCFPAIEVVRRPETVKDRTLEAQMRRLGTIPSRAFGFSSCSISWKLEPQHKAIKAWQPAKDAWSAGEQVRLMIGFDATETKRTNRAWITGDPKFQFEFPLQAWGWDRERCKAEIRKAGLPVPPKSACFFCPAMKEPEIQELAATHPDLYARALAMEAQAEPKLIKIQGLGGRKFAWRDLPLEAMTELAA